MLTMIKELAQWAALFGPPRLSAVYCIEGLVEEEANRPAEIDP